MTSINLERFFKSMVTPSVELSYEMGRECAKNGPNETNCHFRLFCSPEHTKAWERGKAEASKP